MRKNKLISLVVAAVAISGLMSPVWAGKARAVPVVTPVLTQEEAADLQFMREEEKLARDVYMTFYAEWGTNVFNNIARSEQSHTDAILRLMTKYGVTDPALDIGLFSNPELQELFDTLVAGGSQSVLDALKIGALIEEVDMEDIAAAMTRTSQSTILKVYANLMAGSERHLRAFVSNIELITGEPYAAQWISQDEVDAILGR